MDHVVTPNTGTPCTGSCVFDMASGLCAFCGLTRSERDLLDDVSTDALTREVILRDRGERRARH